MRLFMAAMWTTVAAMAQEKGVSLGDLSWVQAEGYLKPNTVVVIPLGAESKEHGPHLLLKNDYILADYFARQMKIRSDVVVAPAVNYTFAPIFSQYPGWTGLRLETARDMIVDICRALSRFGPKRFYVLNTEASADFTLQPAADLLLAYGILLRFTDVAHLRVLAEQQLTERTAGLHADEIETSLMLYVAPELVDMNRAVKGEAPPPTPAVLTRDRKKPGRYSPTGVLGDPRPATREKGAAVAKAMVEGMLKEIESLRGAALTPKPRQEGLQ